MVREKIMTPGLNPPKKKKLSLGDSQIPTEKMQNKVKKKRKNMEVEVSNSKQKEKKNNLFILFLWSYTMKMLFTKQYF